MFATLRTPIRIALVSIIGVVSVILGFFALDIEQREIAYRKFGYYNILLLIFCFAWSFIPTRKPQFLKSFPFGGNASTPAEAKPTKALLHNLSMDRSSWVIILLSALVAIFLYTREGGSFKVLFDEPVIAITAKNLYEKGAPTISETSLHGSASYESIDKRPLLHPSLIALTHHVFGYRLENIFYLNLVFTFLFLLFLAFLIRQLKDDRAAYFGLFLAGCLPLLSQNSSSGALEMLNLLLIIVSIRLCIGFWQRPDKTTQDRIFLAATLLSHTRYESILIILPIVTITIIAWIRLKVPIISPITILLPVFYITLAWQQTYIAANPESFQYRADGYGNFSLHYITTNLQAAYNFMFLPSKYVAGSPFLGFLGFASMLIGALLLVTRRKIIIAHRSDRQVALFFVLFFATHALLILSFYFGRIDDIIVSRLALPFLVFLITCSALLLSHLSDVGKPFIKIGIMLYLLNAAVYAFQSYATTLYSNNNKLLQDIDWIGEHARSNQNRNALYITNYARIFEVEGFNNISTGRAALILPKIKQHLDWGTYTEIYFVQNGYIDPSNPKGGIQWLPFNTLGPAVELDFVDQIQAKTYNICRISRITSIDETLLDEPFDLGQTDERRSTRSYSVSKEEYYQWQISLP